MKSSWRTGCVAVIPCQNEEESIGAVVRGVRRHVDQVLVVNDSSVDRTAALAKQAGATVLDNRGPQGKGLALRSGWSWAAQHGYSWALCLDGDGQHSPDEIPLFFDCAERFPAALVVGNRMGDRSRMPAVRRWANIWMSYQLSRASGQGLPDSQCGFRLLNLEAWKQVKLEAEHFEVESELLLSLVRAGAYVKFVPVSALYNGEHSKIRPLRDTVRWLRWWAKAKCS